MLTIQINKILNNKRIVKIFSFQLKRSVTVWTKPQLYSVDKDWTFPILILLHNHFTDWFRRNVTHRVLFKFVLALYKLAPFHCHDIWYIRQSYRQCAFSESNGFKTVYVLCIISQHYETGKTTKFPRPECCRYFRCVPYDPFSSSVFARILNLSPSLRIIWVSRQNVL